MQKTTANFEQSIPHILQQWKPYDGTETRPTRQLSYPNITTHQEQVFDNTNNLHESAPCTEIATPSIRL